TVLDGGNVGIGDTTPTYDLDVTGLARFTSLVDADHFVATSTSATSTFATGGVDIGSGQFIVQSQSGFVGVASTTPWAQLSVEGQGTLPALAVSDTSNNTDFIVDSSGNVGIGTTSPANQLHVAHASSNAAMAIDGFTSSSANLYFKEAGTHKWTLQMDDSENFNILNAGETSNYLTILQASGRVGIGTTSPTVPLEVEGGATTALFTSGASGTRGRISIGRTAAEAAITVTETANSVFTGTAEGDFTLGSLTSGKDTVIGNIADNKINLMLDSAGNVGIGTTDPLGPVHIHQGSLAAYDPDDPATWATLKVSQADSAGGDASGGIRFQSVTDAHAAPGIAGVFDSGGSGTGHLVFITAEDNADYERMRIDSSGNVGIGTTSPVELLEVNKDQNAATGIMVNNTNTGNAARSTLRLNSDDKELRLNAWSGGVANYASVGTTGAFDLYLQTNNADRVIINGSTGNVGIGTTSPSGDLSVSTEAVTFSNFDEYTGDAVGYPLLFRKARGTEATPTIVSDGDMAGQLVFQGMDATSGTFRSTAAIAAHIDGAPGVSDMPGRLMF
ncbi:MAG: hypothetical protein QF535_05180, partial [Anaerolineales bacterium]|nr:hypothetical protein [Anaerolineales bacterium]